MNGHAAVPYRDVPALVTEIGRLTSTSSRALIFTILTVARTSEALLAPWDEIDLNEKLWTLSAERMKAGAEHKVPLSAPAIDLIAALPRDSEYVFPGAKAPTLSNMTMLDCLRGVRDDGATVHGFPSSFSTWAREQTDYSPKIIEAAMAHKQADRMVAAYARTGYLDDRRELMEEWDGSALAAAEGRSWQACWARGAPYRCWEECGWGWHWDTGSCGGQRRKPAR